MNVSSVRLINATASFLVLLGMLFLCGCKTQQHAETKPAVAVKAKTVNGSGLYAKSVYRIYAREWEAPKSWPNDERITKVSVTIARNGKVISSRIVKPSGDAQMDKSVRQALDRVRVVAPFENGAKENSRTFVLIFNSKTETHE